MSKDEVLKFLKQAAGSYVSGEAISSRLNLSRAAVWKAIKSLRADGYVIDAQSGCGYRLVEVPDVLLEREIASYLGDRTGSILCFDTIDSTSSYLKRIALENAPDKTVAVANMQTAGRGRISRSFQSPANKGVYLSYLMRPRLSPAALLPVTALCAVAICNAIESVCGTRPQIKWVNDLLLNGKKICGILTEMAVEGETGLLQYAVLGIGINVYQKKEDFCGEIAETATSLTAELGGTISRAQLAAAMIRELDLLYDKLGKGYEEELAAYRRDCVTLNREIQIISGDSSERAYALDIDEQFGLIVRDGEGKIRTVSSGEVSVRGLHGYADAVVNRTGNCG